MHVMGPEAPKENVSPTVRTLITCAICSHDFSFEEGEHLTTDRGIQEQVVLCPRCESIFEVDVTPQGITLGANVTLKYRAHSPSPPGLSDATATRHEPNTLKLIVFELLALGFALAAVQMGGDLAAVIIGCLAVLMAALGIYAWRRM